eukprot:1145795-Alexandrium_andersonii.AAC.1
MSSACSAAAFPPTPPTALPPPGWQPRGLAAAAAGRRLGLSCPRSSRRGRLPTLGGRSAPAAHLSRSGGPGRMSGCRRWPR